MSSLTFYIQNERTIDSVETLLQELTSIHTQTRMFFRGLSDSRFVLCPTIGRPLNYQDRRKHFNPDDERNLLHRFRRRAFPFLDREIHPWEALFIARHHGLPTRIMDWSQNSLVALFFACDGHSTCDGMLWAFERFEEGRDHLDIFKLIHDRTDPIDLFDDRPAVKLLYPVYNSPRIVAQGGIFTIHSQPAMPLDKYAGTYFGQEDLDVKRLFKWTIPANCKPSIIRDLHRLGITRRTIYSDLDGLADELWQTEVLFNGDV